MIPARRELGSWASPVASSGTHLCFSTLLLEELVLGICTVVPKGSLDDRSRSPQPSVWDPLCRAEITDSVSILRVAAMPSSTQHSGGSSSCSHQLCRAEKALQTCLCPRKPADLAPDIYGELLAGAGWEGGVFPIAIFHSEVVFQSIPLLAHKLLSTIYNI